MVQKEPALYILTLLIITFIALAALHQLMPRILHGDVRAENFLVSREWHCKMVGPGQLTRLLSAGARSRESTPREQSA